MSCILAAVFVAPLRSRHLASRDQWPIAIVDPVAPVALGPARRSMPIQSGSVMDGDGGDGTASNEVLPWLPFSKSS
jgi:hypothetical protein